MLHFKTFKLGFSSAFELGASLGRLRWGRRDKPKEELSTPDTGAHKQELPTTDWARFVAILAETKRQENLKSRRELN